MISRLCAWNHEVQELIRLIQKLRLQVSKARLKNERIIQNHEDLKKEKVDFCKFKHFYQFCCPGQVGDEGRWIEVDDSLHAQVR